MTPGADAGTVRGILVAFGLSGRRCKYVALAHFEDASEKPPGELAGKGT